MRTLTGECLCGDVRYSVDDAFRYALNCHCSRCRRATGAAFKSFAGIERAKLRVTGEDMLLTYGDAASHDAHCRACGAFLYSVVRKGSFAHVNLGSLTDAPSVRPTAHIYVGSKAAWHTITDDLPQHDELPA